jgi:hypothetical protein
MINVVVEGRSDEEVARKLIQASGHTVAKVVVKGGKTRLDPLLAKYNRAATHAPWVVLRDSDAECPKKLHARLTTGIGPLSASFLLRIAHPMTEGWLLADSKGFADYFQIKESQVPRDPEGLTNAKQAVLALCANSRSRALRQEIVAQGSKIGPLYPLRINEFAASCWSIETAASRSDSLQRAIDRISNIS